MSSQPQQNEDEFAPTHTEGYRLGEQKTVAELAALDQEDESLQRWKASLGLSDVAGGKGPKKIIPKTLFLRSTSREAGDLVLDLSKSSPQSINIKEGVEYSVGITFTVENEIASGLRFIQVVKLMGVTVDKTEAMLGSYGPQEAPYTKVFASEVSPSGIIPRKGKYTVKTRLVDDDNNKWLDDFEWVFKIAKEW